jgi:hypothetical protein
VPPDKVAEIIGNIQSDDEMIQNRGIALLMGYFTENGERPDAQVLDGYVDILYGALKKERTTVAMTEVFAIRYVSHGGKVDFYVNKLPPITKDKIMATILGNLYSDDFQLSKISAEALLNVYECRFASEIKRRDAQWSEEFPQDGFPFGWVRSSLSTKCIFSAP